MNFNVLNFDQKMANYSFATIYVQKGRLAKIYKMRYFLKFLLEL